ncbi:glycosyl transferase [Virgisporangium ochraceum]|uniref:Glycosyl transferase n=1 Tax=Virgisporangium ochraceum TaxID=65505 RepID=A0A8J3ZM83_9ACTN|nr:glycosyl transferase [Virgisporangium ochraceum]
MAALAFVALALWTAGGLFLNPFDRVSAHNPNDQIWFEWLLEHGAYTVRHLENPLFSERQNYPFGVNLMANTSVLGISIPLAPITMVFGSAISYWVFLVGGLAGTAYACYHVFSRHLVTSKVAAWLGGAVIGFAPGIIHHANGQPNFSTHFLVPFLVLYALRLGRPGRVMRDGLIMAGLVVWQFFINQEVLLITAVALGVITLVRIRDVWPNGPRILGSLGITAVVAGALLAYPMWFQFRGPQSYRGLPFEFHSWGEDLAAYVTFARDTLAGDAYVEKVIGHTEQNTWFGWPLVLVVLAAAVLLWRRSKVARIATIAAGIFVVAGIGPEVVVNGKETGIPGPWALISSGHVPVLELLQPTRLTMVVVGVVGLLVALSWDALRGMSSGPRSAGSDATEATGEGDTGEASGRVRAPWGSALRTVPVARKRAFGMFAIAMALVPITPWVMPTMVAPKVPDFIVDDHWRAYTPAGYTVLPVPVPNNADGIWTLRYSAAGRQEFQIPHGYFIGPDENGRGWYGPVSRPTTYWVNHVAKTGRIDGRDDDLVAPTDEMKVGMKQDLVFWKVGVVVIGPHPHQRELKMLWDQVLGPGKYSHGAWIWDVRWLTVAGNP